MSLLQVIILAIIQGLAELLPVSSSAHVILAQHLMGLDPSAPEMTFLLVALHTGTMFAVLIYFWSRWKTLFSNLKTSKPFIKGLLIATAVTGVVGLGLKIIIEKVIFEHFLGHEKGEVESLFKVLPLIAVAVFAAGILIIYSGRKKKPSQSDEFSNRQAAGLGLIQGLCLPFRGFSRSGATISLSLLNGVSQKFAEEFSFALAILLTPPVIVLELRRLLKHQDGGALDLYQLLWPSLAGLVFSFLAGLVALKWLSSWLEKGRWSYFGYYCLIFSAVIFATSIP